MVANGYVMVACVGELSNLRRGAMHVKNTVRPRRFTSDRRFNKGRTLGWSENPLQVIAQSIHSQTRTESVTPVGKYSQRPVNQTEKNTNGMYLMFPSRKPTNADLSLMALFS